MKLVTTRMLPLPPIEFNGEKMQIDCFQGDMSVFDGATIIVSTALEKLDRDMIMALPDSVGLIANFGIGTNNIDVEAAKQRGILVTNTPTGVEDTADLTFYLILAAARRATFNEKFVRTGGWDDENILGAIGSAVHHKTLGIVGFGSIGQQVAKRALGFDMKVVYHGPNRKHEAEKTIDATYYADLVEMLKVADIVSLNCPLTPSTHQIINADRLKAMKAGSVLVNTGRGPLVDEKALIEVLKKAAPVAAAGLDVFENEPHVPEELLALDNVTVLPHLGSATVECRMDMVKIVMSNIHNFLAGNHDAMTTV